MESYLIQKKDKKNPLYKELSNINDKILPFVKTLGEPFFFSQNCVIFNLDCVEAMTKLPKELVDLVVTSPPYNIGKEYEEELTTDAYVKWSQKWLDGIQKICRPNGALWLNLGYLSIKNIGKAVPISYLLWDKVKMFLIQEVVWHYGAGVACRKSLSPRNEKFLWYVKNKEKYTFNLDSIRDPNVKYPNQKKNGKLRCNPKGKNPSDVWIIPKVTSGKKRSSIERTSHPAQFPENVIKRCILASSNVDDIVLDPFMGSGTTAVVALKEKRFVIGFEINKKYCNLAMNRIKKTLEENM